MELLARSDAVTKTYGDTVALDEVSIDITAGEIVGLLGPNGAGKTTWLSLITGLRRPTSGHVELFGDDPTNPVSRLRLGVTPQETGLPESLRVRECIELVRAHYPDPLGAADLSERFGLTGLERRQTGALSGGQKRRLTVALAFAGDPDLVVLDEPTTGLDIDGRSALWDAIRDFHARGGTICVTSHYLEEIEALAQRVVVIGDGHVLVDDDLATVRDIVGVRRVTVTAAALPIFDSVVESSSDGDRHTLITSDADGVVRDLVTGGVAFADIEVTRTSLEDAFRALTTRTPEEATR